MFCKGKNFNIMLYVRYVHLKRPRTFIKDKPILWSRSMLHKDYDSKCSVAKRKKKLVTILKRPGANTNSLALNRKSSNDFGSELVRRVVTEGSQNIQAITQGHGSLGGGNMLEAERSRVRFPMTSLDFSIDLILPAAL
jgi:hypothetical protein